MICETCDGVWCLVCDSAENNRNVSDSTETGGYVSNDEKVLHDCMAKFKTEELILALCGHLLARGESDLCYKIRDVL